jgi:purine catabolism regulator
MNSGNTYWTDGRTQEAPTQTPLHAPPSPQLASPELGDFGLTVADCLAIPPLTRAHVCGGHSGLARRARWVHVIDHDDIEDSLTGNELILSSGVSLGHNAALQQAIFPIMERRASAGLVISLGSYIPSVPPHMQAAADRHGIPLITMPWEVNFRDITQVLLTRIMQNQYKMLEDVESISRSLLRMALNRGTLEGLCQTLSDATVRRVAVADPAFAIMASDAAARGDARFPRMFQPVAGVPALPAPQADAMETTPGHWAIRAPIIITGRLQGYLVVDTGAGRPERFDRMIVETASLVAALLIAQTEEIERMRASRERDSFVALVEGVQDPAKIAAFGPIAPGPYSLMIADVAGGATEADRRAIRRALDPLVPQARVSEYAQQIIALLPHARRHTPRALAQLVLDRIGGASRLGLSRPFASLVGLREAYSDTQETLSLGHALDPDARLLFAEDSAALRQYVRTLSAGGRGGFPRIQVLADHDAAHGSELVRTLECFLAGSQNAAVAARRLSIHRHTLAYRLERITDLLGVILSPDLCLELRLQLIAYRLARFPS